MLKKKECGFCKKKFMPHTNRHKYCQGKCYRQDNKKRIENLRKLWVKINPIKIQIYNRRRYLKNPTLHKLNRDKWYKNNVNKVREISKLSARKCLVKRKARHLALKNIIILDDKLCEDCNVNKATLRHHEDYNKPFDVCFLCMDCHGIRHRKHINVPKGFKI